MSDETEKKQTLDNFYYQNGYLLSGTDMGRDGVKIELSSEHGEKGAIILPAGKAAELSTWIKNSIGQTFPPPKHHGRPKNKP